MVNVSSDALDAHGQSSRCPVLFMRMHSSVSAGAFCKNLTDTLESTSSLRLLWKTFRPFLQGKVLYTPDTNVTRSIVTEVHVQTQTCINALHL